MLLRWFLGFLPMLLFAGCYQAKIPPSLAHEDLDAAVWMRTSAEYRVLAIDTFHRAREAVAEGLKDPTWSALPDQADRLSALTGEDDAPLPTAVIVDVDETVLDTSAYQVRQILEQGQYNRRTWNQWVADTEATLVPGAREFIRACQDLGVTVFFVTNRDIDVERYTRENLEKVGLMSPESPDTILSQNEKEDWTVDKTTRRDYVASQYRVLAIVGDDLNDFIWVAIRPTAEARIEAAEKFDNLWGKKWFMLPNPNYGNWERAIQGYDDSLPIDEKRKRKRDSLISSGSSIESPQSQDGKQ